MFVMLSIDGTDRLRRHNVSLAARKVIDAMICHVNYKGIVGLSQKQLADFAFLSRKAVNEGIQELETLQFIHKYRDGNKLFYRFDKAFIQVGKRFEHA